MSKFAVTLFFALLSVSLAQRFRPTQSLTILSPKSNTARFSSSGSADGRYVQDNSGQYNAHDGRYYHDESGSYVHNDSGNYDGRYVHDDSGKYSGTAEKYQHQDERYRHQDEKYRHQADKFGGAGSGSQFGTGVSSGVGAVKATHGIQGGATFKRPVTSVTGTGISPAGGFGKPVTLKQGNAAGFYDNRNYRIIRQEGDILEDGYHYLYETENGIYGEEQGKLANRGTDEEAMRARGYFTYTGPDNVVYTVTYTADENGFVPQGDHLPTPPPVPEAILRSLEYQRAQGKL